MIAPLLVSALVRSFTIKYFLNYLSSLFPFDVQLCDVAYMNN